MSKNGFRELIVWQKAKELALEIYRATNQTQFQKDFCFRDQIRRAAVSIPSNIAEGDERDTDKEAVRFFYIAKGSAAELSTQLQIAFEIEYLDKQVHKDLDASVIEVGKILGALIKARSKKGYR